MHMTISLPVPDYTCDGEGGGGDPCSSFAESPLPALLATAFAGDSGVTFCLASSSAGQDSAPMTAASGAVGGGVVFLHGDAVAPTPAAAPMPPAGSDAAAAPPTFGSCIAEADPTNQVKKKIRGYLIAASIFRRRLLLSPRRRRRGRERGTREQDSDQTRELLI